MVLAILWEESKYTDKILRDISLQIIITIFWHKTIKNKIFCIFMFSDRKQSHTLKHL